MGNFIQTLVKLIQSLFGGSTPTTTPPAQSPPQTDEPHVDSCVLFNIEIPSTQDLDSLPLYGPSTDAEADIDISAQSLNISCNIQIRPHLGIVSVRGGPRLDFGVIARTVGGTFFKLQGASEKDPDGHRWYTITTPAGAGWVRGDVVIITEDCLVHSFITEDDLTPPDPIIETPTERFPLPADVRINQGYHSRHPAYDLNTAMNTPITAVSQGLVVRVGECTNCEGRSRPNIFPCFGNILKDPAWGYGYGNFVTIRHDYALMPPTLREHMDDNFLTDGFVYILYAHFAEVHVRLGEVVNQGQRLGLSGNHGCSSAPHLHFEVRMGRDETIDGQWLNQKAVNPDLLFEV